MAQNLDDTVELTPLERAQSLALRALVEEKLIPEFAYERSVGRKITILPYCDHRLCRWIENYYVSRDTLLDSMPGLLRFFIGGRLIYPGVSRFDIADTIITQISSGTSSLPSQRHAWLVKRDAHERNSNLLGRN